MKLIVEEAYDNMGLQSTQTLGPILDEIMRNTPEGKNFVYLIQCRSYASVNIPYHMDIRA